ncbi:MAG: helix-turn-helix domain-containing protein [Christensenellales bacterium]|jgi:AraC-like DNA-binding protein
MQKLAFMKHYQEAPDDYRIFYYADDCSVNLSPHKHNYFEMYYLVSGKVCYFTGGTKFHLRPNDILFININQLHHPVLIDSTVPYERILLHVSPKTLKALSTPDIQLDKCFTTNNFTVYHYPRNIRMIILNYFDRLSVLKEDENLFGRQALARACLTELFVEINHAIHRQFGFSFNSKTKDKQTVEIVRQYILQHLDQNITIDMLAEYVYLSRSSLMRYFKKYTGMTIYQFIQLMRLRKSDELINQGVPFTQAAQLCGFCDYSAFYRSFIKEYKISPSEYYKISPQ